MQYADITLNVLIKGKHNNIIGEVQFLLNVMKEFKDKAHNLYAIQRREEAIQNSVSKILPLLMDTKCRLFTAAINGSVPELCKFMVVSNKSIEDLMKMDQDTNNTILHRICTKGRSKAFAFLQSLLTKEELIDYLVQANKDDQRPYEYAIRYSAVSIAKKIFDIKEIREIVMNNDDNVFRLLYHLFLYNQNKYLIDYILSVLNITNEKISLIFDHKYPTPSSNLFTQKRIKYDKFTILGAVAYKGTVNIMEHLPSIISEDILCKNIFAKDAWGDNAIQGAIEKKRLKMVKIVLNIKPVKERLLTNNDELGAVLKTLIANFEESIAKYFVNELELTETRLYELGEMYDLNVNQIVNV